MTLKIGSLFSGYAGLDGAVADLTGAQPAWFAEVDEAPATILAHHYPHVPNLGDITAVNWADVEPVDIITGGSPCQDLSTSGKRAGMTEGTRSNLWVIMREAIAEIKPRLVVWENVQGALSAKASSESDRSNSEIHSDMEPGEGPLGDGGDDNLRALGRVLGDLAEIGYDAQWTTLRASDVGAPHHRARVFLIAWPGAADAHDERRPDDLDGGPGTEVPATAGRGQTLSDSEGCGRDHGQATHDGPADREVDAPGNDCDAAADTCGIPLGEHPGESPTEEAGPEGGHGSGHPGGEWATGNRGEGASDTSSEGRDQRKRGVTGEAQGRGALGEPDRCHNGTVDWGPYAPAVRRWERVLGRPAPNPTEPNTKGNPRLSAAFAEYLMGLPAGWVTGVPGLSRADHLKAIGNGVCPQQAMEALTQLGILDHIADGRTPVATP